MAHVDYYGSLSNTAPITRDNASELADRQTDSEKTRDGIDGLIEYMHETARRLSERLTPVLREAPKEAACTEPQPPSSTPMHAWLQSQYARLRGLHARLIDIESRLEV